LTRRSNFVAILEYRVKIEILCEIITEYSKLSFLNEQLPNLSLKYYL